MSPLSKITDASSAVESMERHNQLVITVTDIAV